MSDGDRLLSGALEADEAGLEQSLRPQVLDEYVGQERIVANLRVFMEAARLRAEPLDHMQVSGPPGLGKTTLAHLVASEMGVELRATSGPAIERPIDLLVLLNSLAPNQVLFIDEIHRMSRVVEEILYPVMEDLSFDRILSKGVNRGAVRHRVSPFTLVGATTRAGSLSSPLRSRFGILFQLDYYRAEDLAAILRRSAGLLGVEVDPTGCAEIAGRCRGTPRIANRLLRQVRDFAQVDRIARVDAGGRSGAPDRLGVDSAAWTPWTVGSWTLIHRFQGRQGG